MKTVIGLAPGVRVSGLAVVIAPNVPTAQAYPDRLVLATELPDPATLAQHLLKITTPTAEAVLEFPRPISVVVCDATPTRPADVDPDERVFRLSADEIAVLKVQGFLEGFAKALDLRVTRVPFPPRDALWNAAWWELIQGDHRATLPHGHVPHHLSIDAVAAVRRAVR